MTTYRQRVAKAKRLRSDIKHEEPRQWELAQLSYESCDEPPDGQPKVSARQWADDIGISYRNAIQYRATWRQFRHKRDEVTFLEAYTLANASAHQRAALRAVADRHGTSIRRARDHADELRLVREILKAHPELTPELLEDPEVVKAALANPLIAYAIASDPTSTDRIRKAREGKWRSRFGLPEPDGKHKEPKPQPGDVLYTINAFDAAERVALKGLRAMLGALMNSKAEVDEVWRTGMAEDLDQVFHLAEGIKAWLATGGVTDADLVLLLEEEGSA